MNPYTSLYVFIAVVVIIGLGMVYYASNLAETGNFNGINQTMNTEACVNLGCPSSTNYVSSTSSNVYFYCICDQAKQINKTDLICLSTKKEIFYGNYVKGYCSQLG